MTTIRALSFDLDDTLWDNKPVIQNAEDSMMLWLQSNAPKLTARFDLEKLTAHKFQLLQSRPNLASQISELRRESLRLALEESGYSQEEAVTLAEGAFNSFLNKRHAVTYFEGVEETLDQLAEKYQLIAITNGNIDLRQLSISCLFSHAFNAEDLGVKKPDPDIYKLALQHAGVDIKETVHIGDCPVNDVTAAQKIGLRTIWYNPENQPWLGNRQPDATICRISELLSALHQLEVKTD
ncbi:HAD family hydrolase [Endozoicomonadaceae bacterium StTr2]